MASPAPRLPASYRHNDFEDLVVAVFQALGYYVETSLVLKAGTVEILEWDGVATASNGLEPIVLEAKSGDFGFSDAFKLLGCMTYASLPRGLIVHRRPLDSHKQLAFTAFERVTRVGTLHLRDPLGILPGSDTVDLNVRNPVNTTLAARICDRIAHATLVSAWKSREGSDGYRSAKDYLQSVRGSFFARSPLDRARLLYGAYAKHAQLPQRLASLCLQRGDTNYRNVIDRCLKTSNHLDVQYVMLLLWRARISILKAVLDYLSRHVALPTGADGLPETFLQAMRQLRGAPRRQTIAYVLQAFVERLGGYYRDDDADKSLLEAICGEPPEIVEAMLDIVDAAFPTSGGWRTEFAGTRVLKMVPAYVRGNGAFTRRHAIGPSAVTGPSVVWFNAAGDVRRRRQAPKLSDLQA